MDVSRIEAIDADVASAVPRALAQYLPRVDRSLLNGDMMFAGDGSHYLSCGASAVNAIMAALLSANSPEPASILDFGAGAGRVTRWLRAAFPSARLSGSDLPGPSQQFLERVFGVHTWNSSTDANAIEAPDRYDLIWAGSVITHLREQDASALMGKFHSWLKPNGMVVASFHGRFARSHGDEKADRYIAAQSWRQITAQCDALRYGYADYDSNYPGYGVSLCTIDWIVSVISALRGAEIVYLAERAWDNHHDVVAFRRRG